VGASVARCDPVWAWAAVPQAVEMAVAAAIAVAPALRVLAVTRFTFHKGFPVGRIGPSGM